MRDPWRKCNKKNAMLAYNIAQKMWRSTVGGSGSAVSVREMWLVDPHGQWLPRAAAPLDWTGERCWLT
jgi:hypothetical protein